MSRSVDAEDGLGLRHLVNFLAVFLEDAGGFRESSAGFLVGDRVGGRVVLVVVTGNCRHIVALRLLLLLLVILLLLVVLLLQLISLNF